jgi:hypothetical protein
MLLLQLLCCADDSAFAASVAPLIDGLQKQLARGADSGGSTTQTLLQLMNPLSDTPKSGGKVCDDPLACLPTHPQERRPVLWQQLRICELCAILAAINLLPQNWPACPRG